MTESGEIQNSPINESINMKYPTLDGLQVSGKKVFVRVDFNVSLNTDGQIRDDARIRAALPTIQELLSKGAQLILASHLGRPKGTPTPKYSLLPVAKRLAELTGKEVLMPDDCVGMAVKKLIAETRDKQIILLENLRFHAEEEACDEIFSQKLAELADVYVNDAFGAMHRAHASTAGMVKHFTQKAIGRLVEREVSFLGKLLKEPQKPFLVILGGAKVSDKIGVIENLMNFADEFIIGGGMAYTFLKAQGVNIGKSLVEDAKISQAKKILERAKNKGVTLHLPVDSVVAEAFAADSPHKTYKNGDDWQDGMALDIGPSAIKEFSEAVSRAKTIFWNGPLGVYEMDAFRKGTLALAGELAKANALTVIGGGDSLAAIHAAGVEDKMAHLSTGGGASLEFLEGKTLPGLKVFA